VYSRLEDRVAVTVFGFPTKERDLYPLPHATNASWRACALMARIPLARRYEERVWLGALFRRLRTFDVVHIHNRPQWAPMLRRMGFDRSLVLHLHNDHLGHWPAKLLDELAPQLNAVAVCSNHLRNTFAARSASLNAKTTVVFNGVNRQLFYPREDVREAKRICFVGRLHPEKGALELVRAYERVLDRHPDAKLVIAGTTGYGTHQGTRYSRDLQDLADSLARRKHAQVEFTGYLDHDRDLPRQFQRASVFACPSLVQETFGLVNAEAMACATPVIGTDRGGVPEVVGNAGRLINPENVAEFADVLSELLAKPEYRRSLGQAGVERCQTLFDWSVVAEAWIQMLDRVMLGRRLELGA
jgi:spore coat protein SA